MQETWVRSLIWEDPQAVKQLSPSPSTLNLSYGAQELQLLSPRATTTEIGALYGLCSAIREATAMRSPHTTMREQPLLSTTRENPMRQ